MAQVRQQNSTLRSRYVQPAAVHHQQASVMNTRTACEQLEQLTRKLGAAHAEIQRYQTRLFACERQMIALRRENAELETACEQAREQALQAAAEVEMLRAQLEEQETLTQSVSPAQQPEPQQAAPVQPEETAPEQPEPITPEPEQKAAAQPPAQPEWEPQTELDHLSVELMNWFDSMMDA